ncbi:MAG: 50S ribosomal protein L13 [Candidatus Buchananbacteria bacterium RIFCSPHIGHO2_01_FULL_46_12]|uniref:Large ribosomal subunit protein uL13 n=3 Tax=Candidatus Buchananiibacteriota TaxID=1817903 RepID=A0A1G1Y9B2_9BACT|nr:MAG: 50S ribosomal protein L13 [Candidatus Buchananbacteria bacterium RIFCSPHIGHO2_01_FULL_46_12]OGY54168.1 MAG: 50S ribosomal protein L13 [Candidatus Buchananbacteria bacterium RIFCSPLOWO2_01_FULL_45_31]OGY56080.1 MAG: 50S ribosomal protein L13 [Candidatus Buchananbacteria bacterium RIFCSPLOWO2_02_FULL_46_11b]
MPAKTSKKSTSKVAPIQAVHKLDATDQILGRLACRAVLLLTGKDRPDFQYHIDAKSSVLITNAAKVKITGKKLLQKEYYHYSGYPGGLKARKMSAVFAKNPAEVLKLTVWNMLPKNKLRAQMIKRLKISN